MSVAAATEKLHGSILHIEDCSVTQKMSKRILEIFFNTEQIFFASNEEEAKEQLKSRAFKYLLVDSKLPGEMEGLDIVRWMFGNCEVADDIIIIACSGDEVAQETLKECGAHYFIPKPLTAHKFEQCIQAVS